MMEKASDCPMKKDESLRDYGARLEMVGEESFAIIKTKFKESQKRELTVDDLCRLFYCDAFVRNIRTHGEHREHYNAIVTTIDDCITVGKLASKVDCRAKRQVGHDELAPSNTYKLSSVPSDLSGQVTEEKIYSMMAKVLKSHGGNQGSGGQSYQKNGAKNMSNPEWCKYAATQECWSQRDHGECKRQKAGNKCAFNHSIKSTVMASLAHFQ